MESTCHGSNRIGRNLRRLRMRHSVSQVALSRASEISRASIVGIESGTNLAPSVRVLEHLAEALGEDISQLFAPPAVWEQETVLETRRRGGRDAPEPHVIELLQRLADALGPDARRALAAHEPSKNEDDETDL